MFSDEELEAAERRGAELYAAVAHAVSAVYAPSVCRVLVLLSDGLEISLRQESFAWMAAADDEALGEIELNAGGFEVYFPRLDEGLWIPDLLQRSGAAAELTQVA